MKSVCRIKTLQKKTSELATLCGVDAVLIIHDGGDGPHSIGPHTWPENPQEVRRILKRYRDCKDLDRREIKKRKICGDDHGDGAEIIENGSENHHRTVETNAAEDAKMLLAALDSKLLTVKERIRQLEGDAAEGIRCGGGPLDGICAVTDSSVGEDETGSFLQLLMDGPDCDLGSVDPISDESKSWLELLMDAPDFELGCDPLYLDYDLEALCEDETISCSQLLMDGPDFEMGYHDHPLLLPQPRVCGVGPSFKAQSDDHAFLPQSPCIDETTSSDFGMRYDPLLRSQPRVCGVGPSSMRQGDDRVFLPRLLM